MTSGNAVSFYNILKKCVHITVLSRDLVSSYLAAQAQTKATERPECRCEVVFSYLFSLYRHITHHILLTSALARLLLWIQAEAAQPEYRTFFHLGKRDQKPVGCNAEQTAALFLIPGSFHPLHEELMAGTTSEFTEPTDLLQYLFSSKYKTLCGQCYFPVCSSWAIEK